MTYQLSFTPKSSAQIAQLPSEFVEEVQENLIQLGESPTSVSLPIASPPFGPHGQLFHFTIHQLDQSWFFTVIFDFSQDETHLRLLSITWRELDPL